MPATVIISGQTDVCVVFSLRCYVRINSELILFGNSRRSRTLTISYTNKETVISFSYGRKKTQVPILTPKREGKQENSSVR